jgi:hypothetical protein
MKRSIFPSASKRAAGWCKAAGKEKEGSFRADWVRNPN